jgi:purine-binding chemotaxis protein CheW
MSNSNNPSNGPANVEQYLSFLLAGQEYGVDILSVQEIKGWDKPTRIPHSPDHVLGVVNLRGAVVPIIDLRRRFGLAPEESGPTTVVIVVRIASAKGEHTAGLVVDAVCEVCNVGPGNLRDAPEVGSAIDGDCVKGLAMLDERMVILLDVKLLVGSCLENTPIETKVA